MRRSTVAGGDTLVWVLALPSLAGFAGCGGAGGRAGADAATVTIADAGATHPTVAVDPVNARAYVAWVGDEGGTYNVYLAAVDADGAVSTTRVNDVDGDAAPHEQAPAQVAVGPDERVYVVWQNNTVIEGRRFPASDLRFAASTDGGRTFGPAVSVNDDAGGTPSSHTFHNVAVARDGTVFVSWIDGRAQEGQEGEADANSGPEIRVARSTDGGASFSRSVVVDTNSCPCCRTAIAVDAEGRLHVAWRKLFSGGVRDIVVATAQPGTLQFGEPVKVRDDQWEFPGCPHAGPSLAAAPDGRLHVAWYTGKDGRQGLWHATSDDGGRTFQGHAPLVTADWVPPSQVALRSTPAGVVAAWEDRSAERGGVRAGPIARGRAPEGPTMLAVGRSPALGAGAVGALAAWLDGETIRARWLAGPGG